MEKISWTDPVKSEVLHRVKCYIEWSRRGISYI